MRGDQAPDVGSDTKKIADPAKRFVNITNWYLKTKRVWKSKSPPLRGSSTIF